MTTNELGIKLDKSRTYYASPKGVDYWNSDNGRYYFSVDNINIHNQKFHYENGVEREVNGLYKPNEIHDLIHSNKEWVEVKQESIKEANMKPFNLEQALAGKPVITRDGTPVTEIYHFKTTTEKQPVVGIIGGSVCSFTETGHFYPDKEYSKNDLLMEVEKKTVWINLYQYNENNKVKVGTLNTYNSKESAEENIATSRSVKYLGTFPIEVEV